SMTRLHKESYIKSIEASVTMDVRSDLGAIKVPTLVVVGSEDRLTTVRMAQELATEIPGAELSVIDDAGHLVNIEKPAEFNAAVIDFLRRHSGRAAA
ncbi:MAG TPA: alpha/beta fold hydrolase, partial [Pseudolabrys sp.]|nr:alpha/beta fold hydrolase [Pseudolabrys sp.]